MSNGLRILYFGNNYVGYKVLEFLKEQKENIVGLVLHPKEDAKFRNDMIRQYPNVLKIEGDELKYPMILDLIKDLKPDLFLSISFGYILKPELLNIPPRGAINLHPAYLPYNKGANPNVWSIIDGTPAGVSLHYMDENIDTGPIITRAEVYTDIIDTGKSLYKRLEKASIQLFKNAWKLIKTDYALPEVVFFPRDEGTKHYVKDFNELDELDINKEYKVLDLINILRARTYPPYNGCSIVVDGKRYHINIEIIEENK